MIAALIGLALGQIFRLPEYAWGIVTVFTLSRQTVGATVTKATLRFVGTAVAAVVSVWMVSGFIQHHVTFLVLMMLMFAVLFYYGSGKVVPYTFQICALTMVIVLFGAPENAYFIDTAAPSRMFEVTLGIVAVTAAAHLIIPRYAKLDLHRGYGTTLRDLADIFESAWDDILNARNTVETFDHRLDPIPNRMRAFPSLMEEACSESIHVEMRRQLIERQLFNIQRLFSISLGARGLLRYPKKEALHLDMGQEIGALVSGLVLELRALAEEIEHWKPSQAVVEMQPLIAAVEEKLDALRQALRPMNYDTAESLRSEAYIASLLEAADVVIRIRRTYGLEHKAQQESHHEGPYQRIAKMLWKDTKKPDPRRIKHGIKTAIIAAIVFVLGQAGFVFSPVTAGVSAMAIMFVPYSGAGILKTVHRMLGILFGGVMAIILVILVLPNTTTLGGLLLGAAPFFFLAGYINAAKESYGYVGFLIAIVLSLTAFSGYAAWVQ